MRLSIWPNASQPWDVIVEEVRAAESAGWDGVYVADHFMPNFGDVTGPTGECVAIMAGLAAATERMRIGSLVFGNTYRHPAVLANQVATIDHMSGGRVLFGLGAGWQENEHEAYGIELPPVKQRLDRFEEAVQIVKGLFAEERFSFKGDYYVVEDAPMNPARTDMSLLVGGSGEKRTMRIAAQYADEWNAWSTPEIMRGKLDVLRRHCDQLGRDFDEIAVSTQALIFMNDDESALEGIRKAELPMPTMIGTSQHCADVLGEYHELGVDEFIVPDFTLGPPGSGRDETLARIAELAAPYRG
jgi:F420-dependent oxidoreductase-like protein